MAQTLSASLVLSLIDKISGPSRAINATVGRLQSSITANGAAMDVMRGRMFDAAAMSYTLFRSLSAPLDAAIAFESQMADVAKVVDFDTPDGLKQMSADIIQMSLRIPIAAEGLAQIVAAAGQAGIAGEELLAFTEGAAKIGVAFDISAGEAGDAMAKLRTALGMTNEQVFALADAMNYLSNVQASGADEILDFVNRTGSLAKGFGLTAEEAAAFGSAMISSGAEVDVAATSFQNMGAALVAGAAATSAQKKAFAALGLNSTKVAAAMQVDAKGTILDLLQRINELPADVRQGTIFQLFGKNADALLPLITNSETLNQALGMVADQTLYAGSAQKEFEARAATTANNLQLLKNNANALGITIGAALLPALNGLVAKVGPVIATLTKFAEANPRLVQSVVGVTSALIGLQVAAIGARYAMLFLKGGLLTAALGGTKAAGGILSLLNPLKLVANAFGALRLAIVGTGIGALAIGLAMAGTWINNNWNGLAEMFGAFGAAFKTAIEPVEPILRPVIAGVEKLFGWMSHLTGELEGGKWTEWGTAAGTAVGGFVTGAVQGVQTLIEKVVGIPGQLTTLATDIAAAITSVDFVALGAQMITQLWEGIKTVFAQMAAWVQSELARIFTIRNPFEGWGAPAATPGPRVVQPGDVTPGGATIGGAFASGGKVTRGMTALVGELGPELVTFGASGVVHPNGVLPRAPAMPSMGRQVSTAAAGQGVIHVTIGDVHVQNPTNANPRQIAQAMGDQVGQKVRAAHTNGGMA